MAVQVSYPGVYIEEFAPGAPIQGVGTNTAAFIGVASRGMMDEPTKITSWDRFRELFGNEPVPGFFLWYAVRGFFENGGQVCYIVRASNGKYGEFTINTVSGAKPLFKIIAREPGATTLQVATDPQHLLDKTKTSVFQPTGTLASAVSIGDKQIVMTATNANKFRPGDIITIDTVGESLQIVRITNDATATNGTLLLDKKLQSAYASGKTVRLADALVGTRTFRLTSTVPLPPDALAEGTMLTFKQGATNEDTQIVQAVQTEIMSGGAVTYRVTLRQELKFTIDMKTVATVQSEEFKITVTQGGAATLYEGLAMDSLHSHYYLKVINSDPNALVRIVPVDPPPPIQMPGNMPKTTVSTPLAGGSREDLANLIDQDFIDALDTLRAVDDVNLVAVPDRITPTVQSAVKDHCELTADRFAVLDCRPGLELFKTKTVDGIDGQREEVPSARGYTALYYPWLRVPPAGRGDLTLVPPSGHVCGIIARSDANRGVHKAPANEIVSGALGVERGMSDIDHGQLNILGINVIRVFQGGSSPVLFGARTTATDRNWQYVNIRRLFLYLEESIQEGIRWAVFEPNNLQLWKKLRRTISDFLTRAWRDGALFGAKGEGEAFYVRIDETLNPFSEQQQGRLNIEIGVRPSYPAEFIIVRIGIWSGTMEINEI